MLWLILAISALLSYSIWGIMNGVVAKNMDPYTGIFFSSIGYLISSTIALSMIGFRVNLAPLNLISGMSLGLATGIGGLLFLLAIRYGGNVNIVVVLTSLYPILTLILNYFIFGTSMSITQIIGAILAIIAVILVSIG
ncbi:MAG: EamA family transporter [Burkholderiales bacterium]|nr:EamA family transporter [Burkholderiales bacterium]